MAITNNLEFLGRVWATFFRDMSCDTSEKFTRDEIRKKMVDAYNYEAELYGYDKIEIG